MRTVLWKQSLSIPMKPKSKFDSYFKSELKKHFPPSSIKEQNLLRKSLLYTLTAPSSYFRPQLSMAVTKSLGKPVKLIFPWAMAIEMIHCGSLIQDDLPCMDNASKRRKKKSNHLVFKEDMALLAGSTLFIEAFSYLLHSSLKTQGAQLLKILVDQSGYKGMMSGQALDIRRRKNLSEKFLLKMFRLKTGSLIEASVLGPALLFTKKEEERKALSRFACFLGQAYQVADDLEEIKKDRKKHEILLKNLTKKSLSALSPLKNPEELRKLALYNEKRIQI